MENKKLEDIINSAWQEAEKENGKKAIKVLESALDEFPNDMEQIQLELAQIYFRERKDLKALELFKKCYNKTKNEEILKFLVQCYYEPNIDEIKHRYINNKKVLESYEFFYGNIKLEEKNDKIILWIDCNKAIYYDTNRNEILECLLSKPRDEIRGKIILLVNELNTHNILETEIITYKNLNYLTAKNPIYLYYEEDFFDFAMELVDFNEIVLKKRIVIINGRKEFDDFFDDIQSIKPEIISGYNQEIYGNLIAEKLIDFNKTYVEDLKEINKYYQKNSETVINNIKNNNIKIMFRTTRFSNVLQYHCKNCLKAAKNLGIETKLVIEKSDIHRNTNFEVVRMVNEFKPDIIFTINHFRYEENFIPKEIIYVTWIQDPMPHIMNLETHKKLSSRDFILNHLFTWNKFKNLNYPEERMMDAPIPSNPDIYKTYELTEEEINQYSCDICFVCHAADFKDRLNEFLKRVQDFGLREILRRLAYKYYEKSYNDGKVFYSEEEFRDYFSELLNIWNEFVDEDVLSIFIEEMYMWINQRIYRLLLVDWLIDAGFTNIKLWGNGWKKNPKYINYAMGPAENGETLSKIYQCSKINVGNNIMTTAAARAWESMLSGGFYMANYIPEEQDITDIRKIINKDDFVMFYDKDDFLEKVKYYLEHEDERKKMIIKSRNSALEKMTFESLIKRMIQMLKEKL